VSSDSSSHIVPTIVLASYRGCAHITEQVDSIQSQTHSDWRLVIRDDGSDDETVSLIQEKAEEDSRIDLVHDEAGRLGVIGNFSRTLTVAMQRGADWIALCDQDDRWLPTKLERQVRKASTWASEPKRPVLLHSDLEVVGPNLEPIHPSLHRLMGLRHEATNPLATLLIQNFVTGCSSMVNRALLELALPIPDECVMYDWWLALCAAAGGRLDFDPEATLLYRQHESNTVGVRSLGGALRGVLARTLSPRSHSPEELMDTLRQAAVLERRLIERASGSTHDSQLAESADFVSSYLDLFRNGSGRFRRVLQIHRQKIRRQNPILDAMLKLGLLTRAIEWPDLDLAPEKEPLRGDQ
jgi:glycosyltransferase involved in cell wall biosynthesis